MSPLEHGEVFVLDDGGEVDLDLGTMHVPANAHGSLNILGQEIMSAIYKYL